MAREMCFPVESGKGKGITNGTDAWIAGPFCPAGQGHHGALAAHGSRLQRPVQPWEEGDSRHTPSKGTGQGAQIGSPEGAGASEKGRDQGAAREGGILGQGSLPAAEDFPKERRIFCECFRGGYGSGASTEALAHAACHREDAFSERGQIAQPSGYLCCEERRGWCTWWRGCSASAARRLARG